MSSACECDSMTFKESLCKEITQEDWTQPAEKSDDDNDDENDEPANMNNSRSIVQVQYGVMRRMARASKVIVMTCASSGNVGLLQDMGSFPLLVLDEAAQCIEPAPLVPLSWGCEAMALVGDEKQLPATILDRQAAYRSLGVSLFERFVRDEVVNEGDGFVQLDVQRRMHPSISEFPSHQFYHGALKDGVKEDQRPPIPGFPWPVPDSNVCFVECGCCSSEEAGQSNSNAYEAHILIHVLRGCLATGTPTKQIGIVAGYSAQQVLLQRHVKRIGPLAAGLRVDTVDGFQGAERDLILASTVRSRSTVGFMRDPRRVNVLMTRARRGLVVFGSEWTLSNEEGTWKPWIHWVSMRQAIVNAKYLLCHTPVMPVLPSGLSEPKTV